MYVKSSILFLLLTSSLLGMSCSPKVVSKIVLQNYPPFEPYESFALFEKNDSFQIDHFKTIGQIEIKESGLSLLCDYETVKDLAVKRARQMGGNCLRIVEHKEPNAWSTCHRIKCDVLIIEHPEEFEKKILWHEKRKLRIHDFKGDTTQRHSQAATMSGFSYKYVYVPIRGKTDIQVETIFDCINSYFKRSKNDQLVLQHEQIHFDISELYARKFKQRILEECLYFKEFESKHNKIFQEVNQELLRKQDQYDAEVYPNPQKQQEWTNWIKNALLESESYRLEQIVNKHNTK